MIIRCSVGTPGELETKQYAGAAAAKNYIRKKMADRIKWADRFNHELKQRLVSAREAFDGLDLSTLELNDVRTWSATDDLTKVTFVYKVEVIQK